MPPQKLAKCHHKNSPNATTVDKDAIVHKEDGACGLIEIKLGGSALIEGAAETLTKLYDKLDLSKTKTPAFRMILVAEGDYAYTREDGIIVCPISALKP